MTAAILAMADEAAPEAQLHDFQALYEEHSKSVFLTALRVTGNPADAEDVLQTVFARILDTRPHLDDSRAPGAYLRRAATNAAIDLLRRKKTRRETEIDESRVAAPELRAVGPGATGSVGATAREESFVLKERLRAALAELSADHAELFVLCYLEGYSYDELADLLGLERGTVASRLHRTRAKLQEKLSR